MPSMLIQMVPFNTMVQLIIYLLSIFLHELILFINHHT